MYKTARWTIVVCAMLLGGCGGGGGGGGAGTTSTNTGTTTPLVTIVPPSDGSSSSVAGSPLNLGGLAYPQGIAIANGMLFVANSSGASISEINLSDPTKVQTITLTYTGAARIDYPTGIAANAAGTKLYVADASTTNTGAIFEVDLTGGASATVTQISGTLDNPYGVALSADGSTLYVANHGAGDVVSLSLPGGSLQSTYTYPVSHSQGYPWDVALYSATLYEVDESNALGSWPISSPSGFVPSGLSFGAPTGLLVIAGSLYVSDYLTQQIVKIDPATNGILKTYNVAPYQPFYLATDGVNLYFTDANKGAVEEIQNP